MPRDGIDPTEVSDTGRRRHFLRAALGCWLVMGGLALVSLAFFPDLGSFLLTIAATTVGSGLLVAGLMRTGSLRLACLVFCVTIDLAYFGLALAIYSQDAHSTDGIMTRVSCLALAGVAIVFSGALIHRWAGFVFAACNTILLAALLRLDPVFAPQVSIPFFWWVLAVAVAVYQGLVDRTLTKLEAAHAGLERAVEERTADLNHTIAELREAKAEIDAANNDLQAFAGAASHDLRSPLTGILGFADKLKVTLNGKISAEELTQLGWISDLSQKMAVIIADFLRLSRATREPLTITPVDVSALARTITDRLSLQHPQRRVEWHLPPSLVLQADAGMVRIVLENLLNNAWKYAANRDPASITLSAIEAQGLAGFSVSDNGIGFAMSDAERMFQPFVRLHSVLDYPGTGVGLATVQRIARRHGGQVWANGEIGSGATVSILFGTPPTIPPHHSKTP